MAKNQIRRCLQALVEAHPTPAEIGELWLYFRSECAYCGTELNRAARTGHLDHVVAQSVGGSNGVHNHVLSCALCNGDEKREQHWEPFLLSKVLNPVHMAERRSRIEAWLARAPQSTARTDRMQEEAVIAEAVSAFDNAVKKMRLLRASETPSRTHRERHQ